MRFFVLSLMVFSIVIGIACRPKSSQITTVSQSSLVYPGYNLVFVSFDALQASHISSMGYFRNTTPTLDRITLRGIQFTRVYSVASWTVPSSMTWFTGMYPSEHGMVNKYAIYSQQQKKTAKLSDTAPSNIQTLADILRKQGYTTGGFTGNAGVSKGFGYDQGFDEYYSPDAKFGGFDESVPRAVHWLKMNRDRKFFLFLHGYDIHGQYAPSGGLDYRFVDKDYSGKYRGTPQEQEILREIGLENRKVEMQPADTQFWRAIYDEKIQRADMHFQDFLKEFIKLGISDRTIFIITSDHGTELHEHSRFDHGFTLYNELLHVPFIISLPDWYRKTLVRDAVSSIDVMPTILDLLDIPISQQTEQQIRGHSLLHHLRGTAQPRDLFSETDYRAYTYKRSIISPQNWKLIVTLESKTRELYDLNTDPGEKNNIAMLHPQRADELQHRLFMHYRKIGHDLDAKHWEPGLNPVYPSQEQKSKP